MSDHTSNDEDLNFSDLMGDVTPVKHDRADIQKPNPNQEQVAYRRAAAITESQGFDQGLSDQLRTLVESEEELIYAQPGIQIRAMRKLRNGQPPWEQGLDLHGYTVEQAREELGTFIRQAARNNNRCVIVVHGKAHTEDGAQPIIKSHVNDWLRQIPQVLAFTSAQQKDGGTGALYVLLKRPKPQ